MADLSESRAYSSVISDRSAIFPSHYTYSLSVDAAMNKYNKQFIVTL